MPAMHAEPLRHGRLPSVHRVLQEERGEERRLRGRLRGRHLARGQGAQEHVQAHRDAVHQAPVLPGANFDAGAGALLRVLQSDPERIHPQGPGRHHQRPDEELRGGLRRADHRVCAARGGQCTDVCIHGDCHPDFGHSALHQHVGAALRRLAEAGHRLLRQRHDGSDELAVEQRLAAGGVTGRHHHELLCGQHCDADCGLRHLPASLLAPHDSGLHCANPCRAHLRAVQQLGREADDLPVDLHRGRPGLRHPGADQHPHRAHVWGKRHRAGEVRNPHEEGHGSRTEERLGPGRRESAVDLCAAGRLLHHPVVWRPLGDQP
mmetsp:Transcript_66394/g.158417  ORF Transcript_66394/g.158417 Transcript_66394/m.158417 type:complete len:320 (-) Transcript_66394:1150-2109(-)